MATPRKAGEAKRRRTSELEKARRAAMEARTGRAPTAPRAAPKKKAVKRRRVVQPKVTPAQKVPSITGGTRARQKAMSDIDKRIAELEAQMKRRR